EVENFTHGRVGVRRHLYKIKPCGTGALECLEAAYNAQVLPVFIDQSHLSGPDRLVDPWACGLALRRAPNHWSADVQSPWFASVLLVELTLKAAGADASTGCPGRRRSGKSWPKSSVSTASRIRLCFGPYFGHAGPKQVVVDAQRSLLHGLQGKRLRDMNAGALPKFRPFATRQRKSETPIVCQAVDVSRRDQPAGDLRCCN